MKLDKNIGRIISKYLNRRETIEERQQLYQWFDEVKEASTALGEEAIGSARDKVKHRLMSEIDGVETRQMRKVKPIWYQMAAACVVFLVFGLSLNYYINRTELTPVKQAELENIVHLPNQARITLSTGEVININDLKVNQPVSIGNTVIEKDEFGQLTYKPSNSLVADKVINTLQTERASQYSILLSDGTRVFLNADSKLSYPAKFGSGDRVVELVGEAYFEVQKTSQHSKFIVKTTAQSVEVLGTKFNVEAYKNGATVKTTLAEGSVAVQPVDKSLQSVLLKPNEQSILGTGGIEQIAVDAALIISWKDGFFAFDGQNTEEMIREIGQWYNLSVDYKPTKKSIQYTGKIPKNINLAQLIKLLSYGDINVQAFRDKNNQLKLIVN